MDKNDALNRENLAKKLRIARVPDHMYNLNGKGQTDERFCLKKLDNQWQVYYSERGVKTTNKIFDSEKDACQYIYDQLTDMRKGDVFAKMNQVLSWKGGIKW